MTDIGANIKKFRLAANMTQEELGSRIGVGKSAIQKYESGAVKEIKHSTIVKICSALRVPPSALMGVDEAPSEDDLLALLDALICRGARELVEAYSTMNDDCREKLLMIANTLADMTEHKE